VKARPAGFTLLELIVVIGIFAIFAAMAYGGLDSVLKTRVRVEASLDRTEQFERAYLRLRGDFQNAANRPIRDIDGSVLPTFVFDNYAKRVEFTRGGWVNSQLFDHTSVIRFLEARFGVMEPNISPWRRAVCGDLTSAFDFKSPNAELFVTALPPTAATAKRAAALPGRTTPETPPSPLIPVQATGVRPSRALPYALNVEEAGEGDRMGLRFVNQGKVAAVFHVYDRRNLESAPRRYTVEPGKALADLWPAGAYDLWVLAPNGFHRHLAGEAPEREARVTMRRTSGPILALDARAGVAGPVTLQFAPSAYGDALAPWSIQLAPSGQAARSWTLTPIGGWYDLSVTSPDAPRYLRRLAGRLETGAPSTSDPAMGGPARMDQAIWA